MATIVNKQLLIALRPAIEAALASVGVEHGVTFKVGHGTYSPEGTFSLKLEGLAAGGKPKEVQVFEANADMLKLPVDSCGKLFIYGRRVFTLQGMRASKVLIRCDDRDYTADAFQFARTAKLHPASDGKDIQGQVVDDALKVLQ